MIIFCVEKPKYRKNRSKNTCRKKPKQFEKHLHFHLYLSSLCSAVCLEKTCDCDHSSCVEQFVIPVRSQNLILSSYDWIKVIIQSREWIKLMIRSNSASPWTATSCLDLKSHYCFIFKILHQRLVNMSISSFSGTQSSFKVYCNARFAFIHVIIK